MAVNHGCNDRQYECLSHCQPVGSAELETVEGFISVERFESLVTPGKILSLSTWEDEAAIRRWRERSAHYAAQSAGRDSLFARYRIRVAEVGRDYDRETSPWRT